MLSRSRYSGDEHAWEVCRGGGSYFWKGGSQKGGFGLTPRTPPLVTGLSFTTDLDGLLEEVGKCSWHGLIGGCRWVRVVLFHSEVSSRLL